MISKTIRSVFVAAALVCFQPAFADEFDDALAAYIAGDYANALSSFREFAEQGYVSAQFYLGEMYERGRGVTQDYLEAVRWYRKAAEQGHATAQFNLGVMSQSDRNLDRVKDYPGVTPDDAEAVKWYRKAAEQGHASAQFNLGFMYYLGTGVPQDNVLAHAWFNLAASQGIDRAAAYRRLAEKNMIPNQIAEAQKLAREWAAKYNNQ